MSKISHQYLVREHSLRPLAGVFAFLFVLSSLALALPSFANAQDKYLRLTVQPITDRYGFLRPVTAGFFLKPADWQYQGGVEWKNEYSCTWGHATQWQINSPDERFGLAALAHQRWYYSSDPDPRYARASCGYVNYQQRIVALEAYLRLRLNTLNLSASDIRYTSYPVPPFLKQHAYDRRAPDGGRQRGWTEVGEISFKFNGPQGRMEGRLGGIANFSQVVTLPVQLGFGQTLPSVDFGSGYAFFLHLSVAPVGQYDPRMFGTIIRSAQMISEYNNAILQHNNKMDRQDRERIWRVGQITHKTNQQIFDMLQESWKKRQKSMDESVESFVDLIREVTPWQDSEAPGGEVEFDQAFDRVWKLEDGSYVLSEGVDFDPNRDLGIDGVELKPVRKKTSISDWYRNVLPLEDP